MKTRIQARTGTQLSKPKTMTDSSRGKSRLLDSSLKNSNRKLKNVHTKQATHSTNLSDTASYANSCATFKSGAFKLGLFDKLPEAGMTFTPEDVKLVVHYYNMIIEQGLFVPSQSCPSNNPLASSYKNQNLRLYCSCAHRNVISQCPENHTNTVSQLVITDKPHTSFETSPTLSIQSKSHLYENICYEDEKTNSSTVVEEKMQTYPCEADNVSFAATNGVDATRSESWNYTSVAPYMTEMKLNQDENVLCVQENDHSIKFTLSNPAIMELTTPTINKGVDTHEQTGHVTSCNSVEVSETLGLLITSSTEWFTVVDDGDMSVMSIESVKQSDALFEQVINF